MSVTVFVTLNSLIINGGADLVTKKPYFQKYTYIHTRLSMFCIFTFIGIG